MLLLDRQSDRWTTIIEGVEATTWFRVDVDRERLVGATTLDAPKGRLVAALLGDPAPERWVDLVAEGDDVLTSFALTGERPRGAARACRRVVAAPPRAVGRSRRRHHVA